MPKDIQGGLIEAVIEARELVQELNGLIRDARRARFELAEAQAQVVRITGETTPAEPVSREHVPGPRPGRSSERRGSHRRPFWAPGN